MTNEVGRGGPEITASPERLPAAALHFAPSVATDVYWILPTTRAFIDAVCTQITTSPWVAIKLPAISIAGLHTALSGALERAHLEHQRTRWLKISDGMSVSVELGAALASVPLTPQQFAQTRGPVSAIVLEAQTRDAAHECEEFLGAFAETSRDSSSNEAPKLIALLPEPPDAPREPCANCEQEIIFSGALREDEMAAYVSVRMTERSGPSRTGLFRRLVSEFAGFDALLAEELIALDDDRLLGLPISLEALAARSEARWGSGRWSQLCYAQMGSRRIRHVLHEVYLARHTGPEQRDATESLRRRYWRACARSILPWLEEHRPRVIGILRPALEAHLKPFGGKVVRSTPSGRRIETAIEDIEYNQIPGMIYNDGFSVPSETRARQAVGVCYAAKPVRDDIAHMRPPRPQAILELTEKMERLFSS